MLDHDTTHETSRASFDVPLLVGAEDPSPDAALLADMIAGHEEAWRRFQARFDRVIFRCITRVTARFISRLSTDDVDEIYATLLLSLLANDKRKLRSFDPSRGTKLSSWVGMLAVNATYDHLRGLRREEGRAPEAEADCLASDSPDPFELCSQKEWSQYVEEALESFSERDRAFMDLYFAEGLEPEEIARRMQISITTVYTKRHKIQARLLSLFEEERKAA